MASALLPTSTMSNAAPAVTGKIWSVSSGGDLQGALNAANLGDKIVVAAGAVFTGTYTLPNKTSGSGWITITSSLSGALTPGDAALLRFAAWAEIAQAAAIPSAKAKVFNFMWPSRAGRHCYCADNTTPAVAIAADFSRAPQGRSRASTL